MISRAKIAAFTVALAFLATGTLAAQFYWDGEQQIPLHYDSTKVLLKFDSGLGSDSKASVLTSIHRIIGEVQDDHAFDDFTVCNLATGIGYDTFLDSLRGVNSIEFAEPYYRDITDSPMVVGSSFVVKFTSDVTSAQVDSINAVYKVATDHALQSISNAYVLRNTDSSGRQVVDLSNIYAELTQTEYAIPHFGSWPQKDSYRLFDHYNSHQSHVKKVIGQFNVASVWDFGGLMNDTVIVAIIDDGVTSHEDLSAARILPGYDYADYDNDPSPGTYFGTVSGHGMSCAGIVAAGQCTDSVSGLSSTTGIVGINPVCKILPVKIFHDNGSPIGVQHDQIADAIAYARLHGADVISCSWHCREFYDISEEIVAAAEHGGRNGRGCVIVFSAGNTGDSLNYPAKLSKLGQDYVCAVSATDTGDHIWDYSSRGGEDLVAPAGDAVCYQGNFWSLDQMGNYGINPTFDFDYECLQSIYWNCDNPNNGNYNCKFGGTSSACPVVSGIASLIWSYDSTLRRYQVYRILRYSAITHLDWDTTITTPDSVYGYGRIDAFRAILSIARGNIDNDPDKIIDISDLTALIDYLYIGFKPPFPSVLLGDVDCSGNVDISDLTALIDYEYLSFTPFQGTPANPCYNYGN